MQNLQKNGSPTEGLGNRCIPISEISEMGNSREAASTSSGSDCTPQERLTTAFKESDLIESGKCSTVRQSGPCDPVKKTANRRKWSKEDNLILWRCYLQSEPEKRGYRQRLHKTWLDNNGADVTEQRLCDQRGQIEKKGWLTSVEMEMIKRELEANVTVTNDNAVEDAVLIEAQTIDILPVLPENVSYETPSEVMSQAEAPLDDPENQLLLDRLKELLHSDEKPIFNLKKFNSYDVMAKTTAVNFILKHVTTNNITETRNLIQAASSLVGELPLVPRRSQLNPKRNHGGKDGLRMISNCYEKISQ